MKNSAAHSLPPVTKVLSLTTHDGLKIQPAVRGVPRFNSVYPEGRIALSTAGKIEMLEMTDILYIKAESNYVRLFVKSTASHLMAKTLKKISISLMQAGFIRVHQSYMVHPSMIKSYFSSEGYLILRSGEHLPVSRANRKVVMDQLMLWSC